MNPTKIEWCDETWNPVSGCSKVSQGCKNCYAERVFPRPYGNDRWPMGFVGPGGEPSTRPRRFTDVRCHPERLDQPVRKVKGKRIFVNSMSDLFHEDVPFEFIASVFAIMGHTTRHTYLVLTKRPARMLEFFAWALQVEVDGEWLPVESTAFTAGDRIAEHWPQSIPWTPHHGYRAGYDNCGPSFPYENVWLGVSCEDQATADERIPMLLQTPAAVRFVSAEPLLGPIDFSPWLPVGTIGGVEFENWINWLIIGGESGPGARPFDVQWARSVIAQCKAAAVPCFVKQLGRGGIHRSASHHFSSTTAFPMHTCLNCGSAENTTLDCSFVMRDRKGGDWNEWPEDLRVREFPR